MKNLNFKKTTSSKYFTVKRCYHKPSKLKLNSYFSFKMRYIFKYDLSIDFVNAKNMDKL